jgi:hypothetical protein
MQQTNETQTNVHIKVEYNNEYRRFVVETLSFEHLERTLRTLLNIDLTLPLDVLFMDDEKDWVLISSDAELAYAWELSCSLLRLSLRPKLGSPASASPVVVPDVTATPSPNAEFSHPWNARGCRGGKRGGGCGRGRANREAWLQMRLGKLDEKITLLSSRHEMLSAKLASEQLGEDKARAITWRISHLQNKIENVTWKRDHLLSMQNQQPDANPERAINTENEPVPAQTEDQQRPAWVGHCGRRGGRGGCFAREWESNPLFAALQERKTEMRTARQGGNKEDIQKKWEALQEAKNNWREAKISWREQNRAQQGCPRKQAK